MLQMFGDPSNIEPRHLQEIEELSRERGEPADPLATIHRSEDRRLAIVGLLDDREQLIKQVLELRDVVNAQ